jgi:hypothetical protein
MAADERAFRRALIAVLARGWESLDALPHHDGDDRARAEQILRLELLLLDATRVHLEREARLSRRQALDLACAIDLLRSGLPDADSGDATHERAARAQNAIYAQILSLDASVQDRAASA